MYRMVYCFINRSESIFCGWFKNRMLSIIIFFLTLISCNNTDEIPKPRGYFRIDFPEKKYFTYVSPECNFSFETPTYSLVVPDHSDSTELCWFNIEFPTQKGSIHFSYKNVNNNLSLFTEDTRSLAYKHTVEADAINEEYINYPAKKLYGIIYHIEGNAASSLQFYLTDSTKKFIRGSLYFNVIPNKDSIAPVADFINIDIAHFIETFKWSR